MGAPKQSHALELYSQHFDSVEGNTTFYAVPKASTQAQWIESVPDSFRFCFKVPKSCTHARTVDIEALHQFRALVERFGSLIGQVHIQLPPQFRWRDKERLESICKEFPNAALAIEVRNPVFYQKGEEEQALVYWLRENQANRVMFDSRGLFQETASSEALRDAQRKKPRLPLRVMATSMTPMVRYIGFSDYESNRFFLDQWIEKLAQWVGEGRTPYFFMHTADNELTPLFLKRFRNKLIAEGLPVEPLPSALPEKGISLPDQAELF